MIVGFGAILPAAAGYMEAEAEALEVLRLAFPAAAADTEAEAGNFREGSAWKRRLHFGQHCAIRF